MNNEGESGSAIYSIFSLMGSCFFHRFSVFLRTACMPMKLLRSPYERVPSLPQAHQSELLELEECHMSEKIAPLFAE